MKVKKIETVKDIVYNSYKYKFSTNIIIILPNTISVLVFSNKQRSCLFISVEFPRNYIMKLCHVVLTVLLVSVAILETRRDPGQHLGKFSTALDTTNLYFYRMIEHPLNVSIFHSIKKLHNTNLNNTNLSILLSIYQFIMGYLESRSIFTSVVTWVLIVYIKYQEQ